MIEVIRMNDNDTGQLPCIEFQKSNTRMCETETVYLVVRGPTLDECRKHANEILKDTGVL